MELDLPQEHLRLELRVRRDQDAAFFSEGQLIFAGAGLALAVFEQLQHAEDFLLVLGGVEQQVDGVLLALGLDDAGEIDVVAVPVQLDGAVVIHKQRGDAGLADVDDVLQEAVEVQSGAHHAKNLTLGIPHQHVDPEFGHAQLGVGVDVEVKVPAFRNQLEKPGVVGVVRVQGVAVLVAGVFVVGVVVEIVAVTA